MPTSEELTDAYVAQLLKRDAERGVSFKRPRSDAPKPNTRFLRNIVRDVDSHNAALKAKEEQEARARLHEERRARDTAMKGTVDWEEAMSIEKRRDPGEKAVMDVIEAKTARQTAARKMVDDGIALAPGQDRDPLVVALGPVAIVAVRSQDILPRSNIDPIASPLPKHEPPPKNPPRGRGAFKNADINARFDPSYDPREDVALEDGGKEVEGGDWDMALEAMRDRAKWRTGGAERLRAAGFTEQEVVNWQGGGTKLQGSAAEGERNVNDLVWTKQGEKRAWDADK
ncbi:hypothetical protein TI39_contig4337g00001 [Zymoseptoria brevis]|uniref:Uncharacterized protein n=1 Tax=Zymoseptoria brevis TaxID=1047168 RepID=A0A0F4G7G2_9PEZI|nr:hypothetical protein TI39_contig4337g00001 [Zymoseptoria brevis]